MSTNSVVIDAAGKHFIELNREIKACKASEVTIYGTLGQRYIGTGVKGKTLTIIGTPGNGLGAYLTGTDIIVEKNAQDAVGDTMNDGTILVRGNIGDATGYGMRGGKIYVGGNAGYRAGIHMKAYNDSVPVIVIGGYSGSFLGEYQAGGTIIVLGMGREKSGRPITGESCATGIHGGRVYLRVRDFEAPPKTILTRLESAGEDEYLASELAAYAAAFELDYHVLANHPFVMIAPDSKNPYRTLYHYY